MKSLLKRMLLTSMSVLLVLFCLCGCMQTTSNVSFKWDGSFDYSVDYRALYSAFGTGEEGVSGVDNSMAEWRKGIEQSVSAQFEDTSDEEYGGLKFTANFKDVAALDESEIAKQVAGIIAPTIGGTDGVMLKLYSSDHIFYKTYQIVGEIPNFLNYFGVDPNTLGDEERGGAYSVTFSVTAPLKLATKANAPEVDGSTYTWRADGNNIDPIAVDMTTSVPTLWGFVLVGVILLAIIILIIVLLVKKAKKKTDDEIVYDEFGNPVSEETDEIADDTEAMAAAEREFYQEEVEEVAPEIVDETVEEITEEIVEDLSDETTQE